ncbi:DNA repair protein rad16 [Parahypoxylon ruwenzoriense]
MPPRTRRSARQQGDPAPDSAGVLPTGGRRGRFSAVPTVDSNSTSSVPTPASTGSDGSDYSTPATSSAVTPSLPNPTEPTSPSSRRRSRLTVEVPAPPQDLDAAGKKPKAFNFRNTRRRPGPVSYKEESEEDEAYYPGDTSVGAALARRLQREEDGEAAARLTAAATSSKHSGAGIPNLIVPDSEEDLLSSAASDGGGNDDEDSVPDPKGKAVARNKRASDQNENLRAFPRAPKRRKFDLFGPTSETDSDSSSFDGSTPTRGGGAGGDVGGSDSRGRYERSERSGGGRRNRACEKLERYHPVMKTMWTDLKNMPALKAGRAEQPETISRQLKQFQLEGLAWMKAMEQTEWKGGLLGDEMGLGKTIQAVSLLMSDYPAKAPSLVLVPPVALMQWTSEIESYTDGRLKTLVLHGTNSKAKSMTVAELKKIDVLLMSYNSLESMYRRQEKGFKKSEGKNKTQVAICKEKSVIHQIKFHRIILDEAHYIKRSSHRAEGRAALEKLRLLTERVMLRRQKKDHTNALELPVKEIYVDRQFFGEEETDLANSIMTNNQRKFDTYVAQGVMLNNYANIFGLIMQMRQVADHPDLFLKKNAEGGQNVMVCCICDEPAEEAIRSRCKHDFCRSCAKSYINSQKAPDCPRCHIPLSIDLEQPEIEQDEALVKKSSIINRIRMDKWTSSSKIELLVHELHRLRSDNATHKSIIFSQFTTMLQLIEWRLRRAGITTVMLDGSMSPAQRQASIDHFMKNIDVECFLVSLKAGGVALNLTEASRVFIVDPWWNPAAEWQSADRCHRIGQTRPCIITRLCIEDSVESRIVMLQEKKAKLIHSMVNTNDPASLEALSLTDLEFLFRGN